MESPVEYGLFEQTVTIYQLRQNQVIRTVAEGAYLQMETVQTCDTQGHRQETKFLLILPGEGVSLSPGDRVYDGMGPEISPEQWSRFIPALVPKLGQIQYVKPCYWQGVLCHTEAGRR